MAQGLRGVLVCIIPVVFAFSSTPDSGGTPIDAPASALPELSNPAPDTNAGDQSQSQSQSQYTEAQLAAFEVYTFPSNTGNSMSVCGGTILPTGSCYLGDEDMAQDAALRVAYMKKAVDAAYSKADPSPTILKVFLAPEFFFRGAKGAYPVSGLITNKIDIANPLYNYVKDERFEDWLFVFGTVIAGVTPEDPLYYPAELGRQNAFYNFAPVVKGGADAKGWLVFKNYISRIDFLDFGNASRGIMSDPFVTSSIPQPIYAPIPQTVLDNIAPWWTVKTPGANGDTSLIEVGGLRVGVEICLDHMAGVAEKTVTDGPIDLQIVVSAGMNLVQGPVITRAGGPAFLVDGMARSELALNPYGSGATPVVPNNIPSDVWYFDSPGIGKYALGPIAHHDSQNLLTAEVTHLTSSILGAFYGGLNGGFSSPPGYDNRYALPQYTKIGPVVDLDNVEDATRWNRLFFSTPSYVTKNFYRILYDATVSLATNQGKADALASSGLKKIPDEYFGPSAVVYKPVPLKF